MRRVITSRSPGLVLLLSFALAVLLIRATAAGEREALERYEFLQIRMGIPVNIVLYAGDEETAREAADAAYDRMKAIDRIMSDYDPDSELMQLCANAKPGEFQKVSPELFCVLEKSVELSRRTNGAFDVSVGPLVKLWRIARRRQEMPSPDRLAEARKRVGYDGILLDEKSQSVCLNKQGMRLDLGAIAKGYAADEALRVLAERGVARALVEAGGDISLGDPPPGREHWRIEVEKARGESGEPLVLELANAAVATSGDAYQYVEIDGVRYSHIIDPKTGLGLTTPGSVTVIAPTGLAADGLASALSVLGPSRGLELIEEIPQAAAYIVLNRAQSGQFDRWYSMRFRSFLKGGRDGPQPSLQDH